MKVLICQPMNGRNTEEILKERRKIIDNFNKLHIDVIDSYFTEEVEGYNNPGLYYLAKTIDLMGKEADAVYFAEGWRFYRGCRIERKICEEYGILILDEEFFNPHSDAQIKRI